MTDSIIDYYQARMEALKIKSNNEIEVYRPIKPELLYLNDKEFHNILSTKNTVTFTQLNIPSSDNVIDCQIIPGRNFSSAKNIAAGQVFNELKEYLNENKRLKRIIVCSSEGSRERIFSLMNEYDIPDLTFADDWNSAVEKSQNKVVMIVMPMDHGFKGDGFVVISEQDILGEKQNRRKNKKFTSKDFIANVASLSIGELVVHIEHGIGKFMGLENITAGGAPHDCLKIIYANDAKLFVPVENIDVLSRYGIEDENIQLSLRHF